MNLKLKNLHNQNIYNNLSSYKDKTLCIDSIDKWKEYFLLNKERKNKEANSTNNNFLNKRIKKNLKGFELLVNSIGLNKKITNGYFLDYSSYVNIYLYFDSMDNILLYVNDTCEARGDKQVGSIQEAINYLKNEDVVISEVEEIFIDENEWKSFKDSFEADKRS